MNNGNSIIKDKLSGRNNGILKKKQRLCETNITVNNLNQRVGQLSLLVNIDRLSSSDFIKHHQKQSILDLNKLITAESMHTNNNLQNRNKKYKNSANTSLNSDKLLKQFLPTTVNIHSCKDELTKHLRECFVIIKRLSNSDLNKYWRRCNVIIPNKICDSRDLSQLSNLNSHKLLNSNSNKIEKSKNGDQSSRFILRERKKRIDYNKMNQGSLSLEETEKDSIPIYKNKTPAKGKKKQDVYDFDSDSEQVTRKMRNTLDKSVPFEKDMKLMMYEIEGKNKKEAIKKKKNLMKTKPKTQRNVEDSMSWKVFYESKHKAQHFKLRRKRRNKKSLNAVPNKELQLPENGSDGENRNIHDTISNDAFGDNLDNSDTSFVSNSVPEPPNKVKVIQNILLSDKEAQVSDSSCNFEDQQSSYDSHDAFHEKLINSDTSCVVNAVPELLNKLNVIESIVLDTIGNKISTFRNHANENVIQSSPVSDDTDSTINIFQHVFENDNLSDIDDFETTKLSSTSLNLRSNIKSSTPWRADLGIKINPHFLQYKQTSLPNYNQEMVMDSSVTDKLASGNKTPRNLNHNFTNKKQSSLLPYVNGKGLNKSPDKFEISLYDIHELSPIKKINNKSPQKLFKSSKGKENKSLKDSSLKNKGNAKVKRQILGENVNNRSNIMNNMKEVSDNMNVDDVDGFLGFDNSAKENALNILNNRRELNHNMNVDDVDGFFGFDNSAKRNSSKENESRKIKRHSEVWLFGKPVRLDDFVKPVKTTKNNVREEITHVPHNDETQIEDERNGEEEKELEIEDDEMVEEERGFSDNATNGKLASDIGLFEDLAPTKKKSITKVYNYPKRKRVRRVSVVSINEDENHQHHRKRKKDMRTKEEEEEADKWATAFNMMCQEVEEFLLEIE